MDIDKLLNDVREAGALAYPREDVVRMLGLDATDMLFDDTTQLAGCYWSGFYATDLRWRKSVFDLAAKGSSPAQAMAKRIMEEVQMSRYYEQ